MAERVRDMVHSPTFSSEGFLRCDTARNPDGVNPVRERQNCLGKVADLSGPVVHLDIDVGVVIRVPWSVNLLVPYSLEIGRKPSGAAGGACEQVTSILEIQGRESRV